MSDLTFAQFFTDLLENSNLSLGDVAHQLRRTGHKISKSTLSRWANGETMPRRDKLELLRQFPKIFSMTPPEIRTMNRVLRDLTGNATAIPVPQNVRQHFLGGRMVYFYGREVEMGMLKTAVYQRQPTLITGLGGIGKTTLARKLLENTFSDFAYGCEALQLSPYQRPIDITLQIAWRLGISIKAEHLSQDIDLALAQLRRKGADKDILFLLDNVDRTDQITPFLYGLPAITWVFTSRRKLYLPAPDLVRLELALPTPNEAKRMLLHYTGAPSNEENKAIADQIATQLGHLPIALRTAGGLFRTSRFASLSELQEWFATRGNRGLQIESWHMNDYFTELLSMTQPPNARILFALCGLFASPVIFTEALMGIAAGLNLSATLLSRLGQMSLLQPQGNDSLSVHPLLHEYTADYVQTLPQYDELLTQFTIWYAHYADERRGEYDALQPDFQNIKLAYDYAYKAKDWESLYLLWGPITGQLWVQSKWTAYVQANERYLEAAVARKDQAAEAQALSRLGWVAVEEKSYETAESYFLKVITITNSQNDLAEKVRVHRHIAIVYTEWGKFNLAEQYLQETKKLILTAEQDGWVLSRLALVAHAKAGLAMGTADYETAQSFSEQALALLLQADEQSQIPMIRLRFGDILYLRGQFVKAEAFWRKIALFGRQNSPDEHIEDRIIAGAMQRLAQAESSRGNKARALDWAYEARDIYIQSNLLMLRRRLEALIDKINFADHTPTNGLSTDFELWD